MGKIIVKRKIFTKWDDTDSLKRMKDSDILAEEERNERLNYLDIARHAASGAVAGGSVGAIAGLVSKKALNKHGGRWKAIKGTGAKGALIGSAINAIIAAKKKEKEIEENKEYNERLRYAKKNALRRERADWKTNMTQRDGYSY